MPVGTAPIGTGDFSPKTAGFRPFFDLCGSLALRVSRSDQLSARREAENGVSLVQASQSTNSFTDSAVIVAVVHVLVGGMITPHRGDAVRAGFGAGDPPVPIVVVQLKCIAALRRRRRCRWRRCRARIGELHGGAGAGGQYLLRLRGLGLVHREIVRALDQHDLVDIPALIHRRQPFGHILGYLVVPVEGGAGQGEIEQVAAEGPPGGAVGGAQAAVMRLAARHDMFDVRLAGAGEIAPGIRAVDAAALLGDDLRLDTLRVRIVVGVVGRTAIFRRYRDAQAARWRRLWVRGGRRVGGCIGGRHGRVGGYRGGRGHRRIGRGHRRVGVGGRGRRLFR